MLALKSHVPFRRGEEDMQLQTKKGEKPQKRFLKKLGAEFFLILCASFWLVIVTD